VKTIREKSRYRFSVDFRDEDRQLFVPTTIRYRLDDRTNGYTTTVIDWTTVSPQSVIEILIPSDANRILNTCNPYENRLLTIQSDYDTDNQLSEDHEYLVRNLKGFN
jgi:hypothetical protein